MKTRALLNDDGRLYAHVDIKITFRDGRIVRGRRIGNSYSSNVRSNFTSMINTAVLDAYYQIRYDNNISDSDIILEFKLIDYTIDYLSDYKKRERFTYEKKRGKNKKFYVITRKDGKVYSRQLYRSESIKNIERDEYLYHDNISSRNKSSYIKFKNYKSPFMKRVDYDSDKSISQKDLNTQLYGDKSVTINPKKLSKSDLDKLNRLLAKTRKER